MVRRSTNSHELKVREHPYRVDVPDADVRRYGWSLVREAAGEASEGQFLSWAPSRPWPLVIAYAFKTEAAREAFAAWVVEHLCQ